MNEVQEYILKRAMQKVASKGIQKKAGEGNWFKDKYEQATDWMAKNLFLSDIEKLRGQWLRPNEPVTLSSELVQGDSTWFSPGGDLSDNIFRQAPKPYEDKAYDAGLKSYELEDDNSLWAKAQKAYYDRLYKYYTKKQKEERGKLRKLLLDNKDTPYIEFRKQHPEFFK